MLPRKYSKTTSTDAEYASHGPHPFIVQVRDLKTHKPLPGIAVGDIGPKYGYAPMDNAYMLFDNFRIPHSALLSRYSQVDHETGAYTKPSNPALVYGSLTYVRANIVMHARLVLARAVTIATRYLALRCQFRPRDTPHPTSPEEPVLQSVSGQSPLHSPFGLSCIFCCICATTPQLTIHDSLYSCFI
jgi:acyl-CoA oxidase